MSVLVEFSKTAKRRNSTLQATFAAADSFNCDFKAPTSFDRPTILLEKATFDYNLARIGNIYYFVEDLVTPRDGQFEVSLVMDVLATYKSDITSSTQYVCYSSSSGSKWLVDTRIPILKDCQVSSNTKPMTGLFNTNGFYVLSVVGKVGCAVYGVNKSTLTGIIQEIQNWQDDGIRAVINDDMSLGYDFSSVENAIESMSKMSIQTGFIGNAFAQAPQCIRSCIWVPFLLAAFTGSSASIYLGNYDTTKAGFEVNADPATDTVNINIPWHYSDWRRGYCEDVYLYLPLVGMVQLSADSITNASSISVKYSATATDGCVCYQVIAGEEIIGTYGGQCSANFPIGINQQASAGEIATSVMTGASKMVSMAVNSSLSPVSAAGAAAGVALEGVNAAYNTADVANSTHLSCVGGIGGGAGVGLDLNITCYTVAHSTAVTPSSMQSTMGLPTMKPMSLSTLTGYCQCANAHVSAAATAHELDAIDYYLNSGFFIE